MSQKFLILKIVEQDIIMNVLTPSCKMPVIFSQIVT